MAGLKARIRHLYEGDSLAAHRFRYGLLAVDLVTIFYLVASSFHYGHSFIGWTDAFFGLYIAADYFARLWIAPRKALFVTHWLNIADLLALLSCLAPFLGYNFGFLRALRVLRLLRSYRVVQRLRTDFAYFRKNEDIILSATNLFIFVFLMTELVLITQRGINPNITHFLDAMYYTVTTLTTTGFGDITLIGESGRLLSIIIMIFGVSLFLRLVQSIFRPAKVRYNCQACGLFLHERDAVHCKHCGAVLPIPSDGDV